MKPRLHLIGIFHTIHNDDFSHCAFTGKALRFPRMLRMSGWDVVEYSNAGSMGTPNEMVSMIPSGLFHELRGSRAPEAFHGDQAVIGSPLHTQFEKRLIPEMLKRVKAGDIICHPFGHAHEKITHIFPDNPHVETGIGYSTVMGSSFKIFESESWRHLHIGKANRTGHNYEWVIPNYFDIEAWDVSTAPGDYLAFMGRISREKGMHTVWEIARRVDLPVVLAGQGDPEPWAHPNIIYKGPLKGRERSNFIGRARCSLMPTEFVEPFGGSGVEGLLCGTPLVSVDYGAFTETVKHGVNGFRCKTLRAWLDAVNKCPELDRGLIAGEARKRYSLENCALLYDQAFTMIDGLRKGGWYEGC